MFSEFLEFAPGVFVASPELCLAQISRERHPARTAQMAFELCGDYRRDSRNPQGFVSSFPVTDRERIASFVAGNGSCVRGAGPLRKAMAFVSEGSRSPMETDVAILLAFSRQRGGRGCGGFGMNELVEVPDYVADSVNQPFYHVDFLWRDKKVAVEYDSDMAHVGTERIARDAARKNSLQLLGYKTLTLTRMQLMAWEGFSTFANALEKALGIRKRTGCRDYSAEQRALWRLLLGSLGKRGGDGL